MNKKYSPIALIKRVHQKIKDRPRPLPADWYYLVWQDNRVVMNTRPLWGYRPAHLVEIRMHTLIENYVMKTKTLPTPEQILDRLREDTTLRHNVAELFKNKCSVEMNDVDYEIGLRHATGNLQTPRSLEAPKIAEMVQNGIATAGQIIEAFYRGENQYSEALTRR